MLIELVLEWLSFVITPLGIPRAIVARSRDIVFSTRGRSKVPPRPQAKHPLLLFPFTHQTMSTARA
jgi:hypothetical protein